MGKWYQLTFQQLQPIHIGAGKWGVINETAIFIPGQTVWGALVNRYLLERGGKVEEVKKKFKHISNFFPAFGQEEDFLHPAYENGGFVYKIGNYSISEGEFRFAFVDTFLQTAVEPGSRMAKDESLHEIDYILPQAKNKINYPANATPSLYWKGIIWIEREEGFLNEGLEIYVGGDSRYGLGKLKLVAKTEMDTNSANGEKWQIEIETPKAKIAEGTPTLHFVKFKEEHREKFLEGEVELGVEGNFLEKTPLIQKAEYLISIGSKVEGEVPGQLIKGKVEPE